MISWRAKGFIKKEIYAKHEIFWKNQVELASEMTQLVHIFDEVKSGG
jgi:hypothetical protein